MSWPVNLAMWRYKILFKKHLEECFDKYLSSRMWRLVRPRSWQAHSCRTRSPVAAYHENDKVSDLLSCRMVDDLHSNGSLRNCISV